MNTSWNPELYLRFEKERSQPAYDLAARIAGKDFRTILDVGSGPGNSTAILHSFFPSSQILGIDSSEEMIAKAMESYKELSFRREDARHIEDSYDLIFSNACLQWIPDHEKLLPFLLSHVKENGVLAIQVPNNAEEPLFRIIKETGRESRWSLPESIENENAVLSAKEYFDILSPLSSATIWETKYFHIMPSVDAMIDWTRSTRLRPYMKALGEERGKAFIEEVKEKATALYAPLADGSYILGFRRLFIIAEIMQASPVYREETP